MEQKKLSQLEAGETFEGFVIIKNASVKKMCIRDRFSVISAL